VPFGLGSQLTTMQTAETRRPSKRDNLSTARPAHEPLEPPSTIDARITPKANHQAGLGQTKVTWVPKGKSCELSTGRKSDFLRLSSQ
jgi:hypothetical protein